MRKVIILIRCDIMWLGIDDTDSLEGGCTGCSATPMTAMQIYYSLMKLDQVEDVVFVNGELPAYMRTFIDDKLNSE